MVSIVPWLLRDQVPVVVAPLPKPSVRPAARHLNFLGPTMLITRQAVLPVQAASEGRLSQRPLTVQGFRLA